MVSIQLSFQPGVSYQQIVGFEMAARIWSEFLDDDVPINLHIEATSELPDNVVGGAIPIFDRQDYRSVRQALEADQTTRSDRTAVSNLAEGDEYQVAD